MSLPIRAYRLGTARNAYESHGETVRRLVDQILGEPDRLKLLSTCDRG